MSQGMTHEFDPQGGEGKRDMAKPPPPKCPINYPPLPPPSLSDLLAVCPIWLVEYEE